jgi:hypothetical protein
MSTTASKKAKGRRLQQYIVDKLLEKFPELTERDIRSTSMGKSGEDIELSEVASKSFPFSVEAKNQESLNIWAALEQAEGQNRELKPLVVFKRNRTEVYCALKFEDLIQLL